MSEKGGSEFYDSVGNFNKTLWRTQQRYHFAGLAMQAIISKEGWWKSEGWGENVKRVVSKVNAEAAVQLADALLAELEKEKP